MKLFIWFYFCPNKRRKVFFMNRKLTKTLLLLVCLSTQGLAVNDNQTSFDFSKLKPKELAYESSDHQLD